MKNFFRKNFILFALMIAGCINGLYNGYVKQPVKASEYPLCGCVVAVNRDSDTVQVEDNNGFIWEFVGCEDYMEGDIVAMIMNDMGTEKIFDDEIVKVKYCG